VQVQQTAICEKPVIAVVIGDPAGVGPEVCVKAFAALPPQPNSRLLLIGSHDVLRDALQICNVTLSMHRIEDVGDATFNDGSTPVLDPGNLAFGSYRMGTASAACGAASFEWVRIANQLCSEGRIQGFVMGPVNAEALRRAGHDLTEALFEPPGTFQLRVSGALRAVPLTEHMRLREVAASIRAERILRVVRLTDQTLRRWGVAKPRIAVAGLNPHAMFEEEESEIKPAVLEACKSGIDAVGPISPDSVFRQALEGQHDVVVTMYHDQGQIAVKTVGFAGACTIFLGLPYVRVGIPHGTAFDIAGKGRAQHLSMLSGVRMASALATGRGFVQTSLTAAKE
jgi:4-hydroxythreonine-4-phosphate dehydrogenase